MSFILEALRKSESERQRLGTAAIADLPIARRRRGHPWWVFALSALLVVNLAVLAVVLLRDRSSPSAPAKSASNRASSAVAAPVAPRVTPEKQLLANAPISSNASNVLQEAAAPAQIDYETVSRHELELANAGASVPDGPTLVRPADALRGDSAKDQIAVKEHSAGDRDVANAQASQELHIDLHVFSNNVSERFVLINMRRYKEGQQLPNGAVVERITPEGVVLYQNGSRYQLSRM